MVKIIAYDDTTEGDIHLYHMLTGLDSVFKFNGTTMDPTFGVNPDVLYFSANTGLGFYIWNASIDGANPQRLSWLGSDTMPQMSPAGASSCF